MKLEEYDMPHLSPDFDFDTPFGVILAIIPDDVALTSIRVMNHQIGAAGLHCEEDPIIFSPIEQATSIPHMTMMQMTVKGKDTLHQIGGEMEQLTDARKVVGPGTKSIWMAMNRIETWNGDEWLFMFPDAYELSMNLPWHKLRHEVFSKLRIQLHRCEDQHLPENATREQREWHEKTGYAYCDLPHITLASLKPGAVLPSDLPRELLGILFRFNRLVLGLRGPRGTITQIIHEVPLGG